MDALQENVSVVVEQMIQSKDSPVTIFERVRQMAYAARGEEAIPFMPDLVSHIEMPRLTESWFC